MKKGKTFCENCRNDVLYDVEDTIVEGVLGKREYARRYKYKGKKALCRNCKKEVYVASIEDENLELLYEHLSIEEE